MNKKLKPERFHGYKHWTLEEIPRCFYVGKGRKGREKNHASRNHKWHAIVKRFGLRVEICIGPVTNEEACTWEIMQITNENTFTTNHLHDDLHEIKCNFTKGGDGMTGFCRPGWHHTEETKALIRKRRPSGWHHSDDSKQRISQAGLGRSVSHETREKNRQAAKRENLSSETLRKRSESSGMKIAQYDDQGNLIAVHLSMNQAAIVVHGQASGIYRCCIGRRKTHKGFGWKKV